MPKTPTNNPLHEARARLADQVDVVLEDLIATDMHGPQLHQLHRQLLIAGQDTTTSNGPAARKAFALLDRSPPMRLLHARMLAVAILYLQICRCENEGLPRTEAETETETETEGPP